MATKTRTVMKEHTITVVGEYDGEIQGRNGEWKLLRMQERYERFHNLGEWLEDKSGQRIHKCGVYRCTVHLVESEMDPDDRDSSYCIEHGIKQARARHTQKVNEEYRFKLKERIKKFSKVMRKTLPWKSRMARGTSEIVGYADDAYGHEQIEIVNKLALPFNLEVLHLRQEDGVDDETRSRFSFKDINPLLDEFFYE